MTIPVGVQAVRKVKAVKMTRSLFVSHRSPFEILVADWFLT